MNSAMEQRLWALEAIGNARLMLLLTRSLCSADPLQTLQDALRGGVAVVQVREKHMPHAELVRWVRAVHALTAAHKVPLIVNDDALAAIEAGAEGVHLGQEDQSVAAVRGLQGGAELIIGLSTHSVEQVMAAPTLADYLGFGPLFDSSTKSVRGQGLATLGAAIAAARVPLFGIGGINATTLPQAAKAGLQRSAVSSALCAASDPELTARSLLALLACAQ